jgi:hypothetical protein
MIFGTFQRHFFTKKAGGRPRSTCQEWANSAGNTQARPRSAKATSRRSGSTPLASRATTVSLHIVDTICSKAKCRASYAPIAAATFVEVPPNRNRRGLPPNSDLTMPKRYSAERGLFQSRSYVFLCAKWRTLPKGPCSVARGNRAWRTPDLTDFGESPI